MTETEKKALALVRECESDYEALCRAIEQHEAFKREVSDAVEKTANAVYSDSSLIVRSQMKRFILPKPDPLVEAVNEAWGWRGPRPDVTENLRAAIEARGGRIVWEGE